MDAMWNGDGVATAISYVGSKDGYGACLVANGTTSKVNCGSAADIDDLTVFSIAFLMKPHSDGGTDFGRIVCKGNNLLVYTSNEADDKVVLRGQVQYDDTDADSRTLCDFPLNEWTRVVVTYDGGGDRKIHIYRNGSETGYGTQDASVGTRTSDAAADLFLCNLGSADTHTYDGELDRLCLWARVLTTAEITQFGAR